MQTLYFIHIPKTAGTSFRYAAIKKWGKKKILNDYGDSRATSAMMRSLAYQQQDYYALKEHLREQKIKFMSGHSPVKYFRRIFPASNMVTFLRNPVERVLSHYQFARREQQYARSLQEFVQDPDYQNLQSRYLEQMPLELIGFVGITERYSESLRLFNHQFDCRLRELTLNTQRSANDTAPVSEPVDSQVIDQIRSVNDADMRLYESGLSLFESRLAAFTDGVPYIGGKVQSLNCQTIAGWATNLKDGMPVAINILVNGEVQATVTAKEYQPQLKERNAPRDGYIGFRHRFAQSLAESSVVQCRPVGSGQVLRGPSRVSVGSD